jgi:hypothetical protein
MHSGLVDESACNRLARECAKLDPQAEQRMAEEWFSGEAEQWPEY